MSLKDFDPGDVSLVAEGLLNKIYELSREKVEAKKLQEELDYLYITELVDEVWNQVWASPDGSIISRMMNEQMIFPHQIENIKNSKIFIINALLPYIISIEKPVVCEKSDEDDGLPVCEGYYWSLMKRELQRKYSEPTVQSIDRQSSRVLKRILFSHDETRFRKMGLVVGQVQMGKTANYTALIAKACDAGYKLIIVLSGIHNDLRQQTQERLDEEFLGYHEYLKTENEETGKIEQTARSILCGVGIDPNYDSTKAPESGTFTDDDFRGVFKTGAGKKSPLIFVIKKQTNVFAKLKNYFSEPSNLKHYKNWPLLIIDDEADQASLNTGKGDLVTATNRHIRSLLQLFPCTSFIGYTATPFANVLIDAKANHRKLGIDLFPRDFIISLPTPINYFGPKQFFGDNLEDSGLELFMPICEQSSSLLTGELRINSKGDVQKNSRGRHRKSVKFDQLPAECLDVVKQFILSSAIRLWRFKKSHPNDWLTNLEELPKKPILEMSALVHVSSYVRDQQFIAKKFADLFNVEFREPLLYGNSEDRANSLNGFKQLFENQKKVTKKTAVKRAQSDIHPDWRLPNDINEISEEIKIIVADTWIRVVNGDKAMTDLVFPEHEYLDRSYCSPVIFIGGNKLSRGLTLPGLCVSLFLRSSTMYDTLLQMGRWFGYRDGYVDLCRICTTTHIIDRFRAITEACIDFEKQIDRMSSIHRTPENYRLTILSHTGLQVTARNKMAHSEESRISFNGYILECRDLSITSENIYHNWLITKNFVSNVKRLGDLTYASEGFDEHETTQVASFVNGIKTLSGRVWKNVPVDYILNFLDSYKSNKNDNDVYRRGVVDYIRKVVDNEELLRWNVFIPGEYNADDKTFNLKFIKRKMEVTNEDPTSAYLPALKGGNHEYVGVPQDVLHLADSRSGSEPGDRFREVRKAAGELHPEHGYLILYLMKPHLGDFQNDIYVKSVETQIGEPVPFVSYYVWLPKSPRETQTSMAVFNKTVVHREDDEWNEEPPYIVEEK